MEIRQKNAKGIILDSLKTWEELDTNERQALIFPSGTTKENYQNYQVRRNKHNEIIGVQPHEFSEKEKEKIANDSKEIDIVDVCLEVFGNKEQRLRTIKKRERAEQQ